MLTMITDGRSSQTAAVENNRLATQSVTQDESSLAAINGKAFNINTGNITLTNANVKNAVFYLKNNSDDDLLIEKLFYIIGNSTGGTGNVFIEAIRNPTAGTIVAGATVVSININRNFGSNDTVNALAYKGATGLTFTDGIDALGTITNTGPQTIVVDAGVIILKKGSAIGVNLTTPTGNTSVIIQIAAQVYLKQLSDIN